MSIFTDFAFEITAVVLSIISVIIFALRKRYNYWKDRNVPFVPKIFADPILCFRGNQSAWFENIYKTFKGHPYVGFYGWGKPSLVIRDPKLIQRILVTDFTHFTDRFMSLDENLCPLVASIFFLTGERRKKIRAKLTESFSSSRIKAMFPLVEECVNVLDKNMEELTARAARIDVEFFFSKFSMDVIGACAFGLNFNAIRDENSDFRRVVLKRFISPFTHVVKLVLSAVSPKLVHWFKMLTSEPEVEDFFRFLTRDSIKWREKNEHKRKDFMQLLINKQKEEQELLKSQSCVSEPLFTETVIMGNAYAFFVAGYKTAALALAFCTYELALNPDVMEKLYQEIVRVKNAHDGIIDFTALKDMHYMDCVIYETLRLHPFTPATGRTCVKDYNVPKSSLIIEKGTKVFIPTCSMHLDPEYFPEPNKFDPDRFNQVNKAKIIPETYIPFGEGPRKCIGAQFAMMEMKAVLARVIGKYAVYPTKETEIPVLLKPNEFANVSLNGIQLRFEKRETSAVLKHTKGHFQNGIH